MADENEEDPWDTRIAKTGCYEQNERLQICRYDTGDWRKCLVEMKALRDCWEQHKNDERVQTINFDAGPGKDYNLKSKGD